MRKRKSITDPDNMTGPMTVLILVLMFIGMFISSFHLI